MSSFVIKVPEVGESVTEATVGEWLKKNGEWVERDEPIVILETDKASVDVVAERSGLLKIQAQEGETLSVGKPLAHLIEDESQRPSPKQAPASSPLPLRPLRLPHPNPLQSRQQVPRQHRHAPSPLSNPNPNPSANSTQTAQTAQKDLSHLRPSLRSAALQKGGDGGTDPSALMGASTSGAIAKTKAKLPATPAKATAMATATAGQPVPFASRGYLLGEERSERKPMSSIRLRIAERLLQAQQNAAILTTFNEIDMTQILRLRQQYKSLYEEKHGVRLGFMGFFVKAVVEALQNYPAINAFIEGRHIIYHHFYHIGVAVGSPRGLVVPVIRHADALSLADIERAIHGFAFKAKEGKLTVEDMQNGTFTVSNGGVYGSLLSTPILNPPQSGILGMHKIEQRPVVVGNEVVIRPMMYVALSYDHRIVDGKEAVSFLVRIKECVEDPERLLLQI